MNIRYLKDSLTEAKILKYKSRSQSALNGIENLLNNLSIFNKYNTIRGRYLYIASMIGLKIENDFSAYNFFMPIESNIVFLLRFSNHDNRNPKLYNKHERLGRPDKRFIFYFLDVQEIIDNTTTFLDAEHHDIQYPDSALFDEQELIDFLNSLKMLFTKGKYKKVKKINKITKNHSPKHFGMNTIIDNNGTTREATKWTHGADNIVEENKIKIKNMNRKQIRLNESQLNEIVKKVINESVKNLESSVENLEEEKYLVRGVAEEILLYCGLYKVIDNLENIESNNHDAYAQAAYNLKRELEKFIKNWEYGKFMDYLYKKYSRDEIIKMRRNRIKLNYPEKTREEIIAINQNHNYVPLGRKDRRLY